MDDGRSRRREGRAHLQNECRHGEGGGCAGVVNGDDLGRMACAEMRGCVHACVCVVVCVKCVDCIHVIMYVGVYISHTLKMSVCAHICVFLYGYVCA